jgi:hypothetical protein
LNSPETFIIAEVEGFVLQNRSSDRTSKLVLTQRPFFNSLVVFKPVRRIELVVPEELPDISMDVIGSALDGGIQNRTCGASQLSAELSRLHLELGDRIYWRENDEVCAVQEVYSVRVIVDSIQKVVVLRRLQAIGGERTGFGISTCICLGRLRAGTKLREEGEVASIKRKVVHCSLRHHLSHRRVVGLQDRRCGRHLDCIRRGTGLELHVYLETLRDVHGQILLGCLAEPFGAHADRVVADSQRRERVITPAVRRRLQS